MNKLIQYRRFLLLLAMLSATSFGLAQKRLTVKDSITMNKGFGTNWADINRSTVYVNCDYKVNLPNWNNKTLEVSFKPFSYPCVMVLEGDEDFHDNTWCNVMFVYKDDFK